MQIKSFRVKNYKSIEDSGECFLSTDGITILAGKNESGKTSILEAINDFDTDSPIHDEAIPITNDDVKPQIELKVVLEKSMLEEILKKINHTISTKLNKTEEVLITKQYPNIFILEESFLEKLQLTQRKDDNEATIEDIQKHMALIEPILKKYPVLNVTLPPVDYSNNQDLKDKITTLKNQITPTFSQVTDDGERNQLQESLDYVIQTATGILENKNPSMQFIEELKQYIPNFILFSSFDDIFPNQIPVAELDNNEWIQDLSVISNLDVNKIKSNNKQQRSKHTNDLNIEVNEDYSRFWTQDDISIKIEYDNQELLFWVYENGFPYKPSQRSKGQQWHMSFYTKVSARAREDVPNVILIDEPGLYLHAKAQRDILNKLEDISKDVQVVFTTHSSYLLENENFHRIRLVVKDKHKGTQISNKVHALADKETLTPILTAIGLELNASIEGIDKINNVVVEGQSDVYYLLAFKILSSDTNNTNIIFGGGAGNMPFVGTILHGWGCKVLYLYDNDQGFKDGKCNLENNWGITELVEMIMDKKGSIEDIFTTEDFRKFVLNEENIDYKSANSAYLKKSKRDKVLISKLFLERVKKDKSSITLTKQTRERIEDLLKKINESFKNETN